MTPLSSLLSHKLSHDHVGSAHAISRRDLLRWLRGVGVETTDRKELGDVAACANGYFLPSNREEAIAYDRYMDKKIFPLFEDKKRFHSAWPQYFDGGQLTLF